LAKFGRGEKNRGEIPFRAYKHPAIIIVFEDSEQAGRDYSQLFEAIREFKLKRHFQILPENCHSE